MTRKKTSKKQAEARRAKAEELLAKANDVLDERGWASGTLVDGRGAHCALGAIGYARFGEKFDSLEREGGWGGDALDLIAGDPVTREAVVLLANEIRGKDGRKLIDLDEPPHVCNDWYCGCDLNEGTPWGAATNTVVEYNDSTKSNKGIRVRNRFAKWKKDMTAKRRAKVVPVDHPLEVEIKGTPVVAPVKVEVKA